MNAPEDQLAFPKPRRRTVDPRALKEYARTHPRCEIRFCKERPCPEPHHLISRKQGGDDVASNLLRLCLRHHWGVEGWHQLGALTWFERFRERLSDEACAKVRAALRLEE